MTRSRWVLIAWGVIITIGVAGLILTAVDWDDGQSFTPHSLTSLGFASVGALIMVRRPHRIGALFLCFGAFAALTGALLQTCRVLEEQGIDGGVMCGDGSRLGSLLWPVSYLFFGSLFLVFPTGRLPSRRWVPLSAIFFGSWGTAAVGSFLMGDVWIEEHLGYVIPVAVWSLAGVALAPLFRIRKADPTERQQLRWLGYVIALGLLLLALIVAADLAGQRSLMDALTLAVLVNVVVGVPAAITIAILRYRLYEIDAIVNRTLVYVLLSAGLVTAYLGCVVVLQQLLGPVTADSDVAVAGSTLAVAAMFRPLRSRVQSFIDHRFYRRKYDAAATLGAFSARLRDEVDLESLRMELVGVVAETMQPAHASVWLRSRQVARDGGPA
ncbi:MAG TPA: hypothetical protein VJ927_00450 [Actinomycetota bacterium]|nr:hypothetical protein [Actinomycetota bacterium]